ncbi:hypothetical protein [Acidimangrovimonas pyrenivorans]|uniref:Uncharacterized protein n=1 Tax=Acidimangrovimonas pyrenivorans TaxID=2030798 RepID=A0ABV7ADC7_9RHOB
MKRNLSVEKVEGAMDKVITPEDRSLGEIFTRENDKRCPAFAVIHAF